MKKALISPNETIELGYRVAQIVEQGQTFEVGGCFWVDCNDDIIQDKFWFDPSDNKIKIISVKTTENIIIDPPPENSLNVSETIS